MNPIWDLRLQRASNLAALWPFAAEPLRFYKAVTSFQRDLTHRLKATEKVDQRGLDAPLLAEFFPPFLAVVEKAGPIEASTLAQKVRDKQESDWQKMLRAYWSGPNPGCDHLSLEFFPKAILQPHAMILAERWTDEVGAFGGSDGTCPFCGRQPVVGIHGDGERAFVCSLCSTRWRFPESHCPRCHETRPEKLRVLTTPEIAWMSIEACDTCGHYLKAVDLARQPEAVPVVDEIAAVPLDQLARRKGYSKVEVNVVGV